MGKGQSEIIKAILLIGIMVVAMLSYIEITSTFTSSYEEELVTRSFRQIGTYIVETVNHNQAALSANPTATEAVDYVIVNLDIPKKVGDHYYTIQVKENKFWIYANDEHSLAIEYPKDGFEGYTISGSINSIAENHYLSIGGPSNYLFSSKLFYNGEIIPEVGDLNTSFEYWVIFENANINEVSPEEEDPSDVNAILYVSSGDTILDYKMKKATPSKPGIPIPANLDYLTNGRFDDGELFYKQLDLLSAISLDQSQGSYFYYFKCEYQGKTEKFPFDKISGPKIPINLELTASPEYIYAEDVGSVPNESSITIRVTDRNGDPISGAEVRLSTTLGHFLNGKNEDILSTVSGEITTTLSSRAPGIAKITASTFGVSEEVEVTIHGVLDHISIEYYGGDPVTATTMVKGQSKPFYARGYDSAGLLLGDVEVDWSTTGSLDDTDLDPKDGIIKTTFAPSSEGAGRVVAVTLDGEHTGYTGWITCFVDVYSIKIIDEGGIPVGDLTITTADENVILYCKGYDRDDIFVRNIDADWELVTGSLSFTPPENPTDHVTLNPDSEGDHIADTSGIIRAYTGVFEDYTGTIRVDHHPNVDDIEIFYDSDGRVPDNWDPDENETYDLCARGVNTSNRDNPLEYVYVTWSKGGDIGDLDPEEGVHIEYDTGNNGGNSGKITVLCSHYTDIVNVDVQSSCPFVYSYNNDWHYEHESYPFAIAKSLEYTSYELLDYSSKIFKLSEERDEISYTNEIYLIEVGENVYPDVHGDLHRTNEKISPYSAYSEEKNILDKIIKKDSNYWIQNSNPDFSDSLILEFETSKKGKAKLFLTVREGERSVYLLKCIHEHMGINNMGKFYSFVEDNFLFRPLFKQTVRREFFMHVDVWNGKKWIRQEEFGVGREGFIDVVLPIEIYSENPKIRLSTGSGAYEIDYAFIDTTDDGVIDYRVIKPSSSTIGEENVLPLVLEDDEEYLKMLRGDSVKLMFETREGYRYIVAVKGYYHPFFGDTYVSEKDFLIRLIDLMRGITERGYIGRKFEG